MKAYTFQEKQEKIRQVTTHMNRGLGLHKACELSDVTESTLRRWGVYQKIIFKKYLFQYIQSTKAGKKMTEKGQRRMVDTCMAMIGKILDDELMEMESPKVYPGFEGLT